MLTFYDANYNYLRLKFLDESINPPCEFFSTKHKDITCEYCEYRKPCSDMRRLIARIEDLMSERKDKSIRPYHKHKK